MPAGTHQPLVGRADGRQLAHLLRECVIAWIEQRAGDVHADVQQRGSDAAREQKLANHDSPPEGSHRYGESLNGGYSSVVSD
jgi:hypothetical protein